MAKRGALIILEGCDCSGKSTQAVKLVEGLCQAGIKALGMRFPDRSTAVGNIISDYLKQNVELDDHCIHLLYSANRWEKASEMCKLLKEGTTLVVDRYAFSGVAFTAAKGLNIEWCKQPEIGLPRPDATLFLQLSTEEISRRRGFGSERYEKVAFQEKVTETYKKLVDDDWQYIDANKEVDELHKDLLEISKEIVQKCQQLPLKKLWTDE